MAKTLELLFLNAEGKTAKINIESPIEPVDQAALVAAMDTIITNNVFTTTGGDFVAKKSARIVERNVTDIKLG
ncbi:DUF2922 domain-containing protein [Bacillus weihaiensis]|uniref:DUF2922 domain-containing protein n=1 Tax=Bacillus weihaiensis TaxID=1547283 RepID=A0A1L3MMI2_9BACI|nr:DUF2922 domain-containing protein [Bacillus weihaiensis]APH03522.1 hypothetical protein A9C19_01440 [Bacillus weihaiensis]